MSKTAARLFPGMPAPGAGMTIEPVTTYEELPVVTDAARAELLASLASSEDELRVGPAERMSVAQFQEELRADFEAITGYKVF